MSTNLMSERISIHIIVPNLPWRSKTKNFLSIFCRPPPHPPPRKRRKVRKIFGFCSRDRRERTRRAISPFSAQNRFEQSRVIQRQTGKVKEFWFASLRSATNSY